MREGDGNEGKGTKKGAPFYISPVELTQSRVHPSAIVKRVPIMWTPELENQPTVQREE